MSVPQFNTLLFDLTDGIATITLNRPERMNAFTYPMAMELLQVLDVTDGDDEVKAVIITGAGDRAFCAGADLEQDSQTFDYGNREDRNARPQVNGIYRDTGGRVTLRIFDSLKPIIGAVNGAAVGFGATILLPMDVRIAADRARFGFAFARRGIVPEAASSWFLPRIVGISTALEWCYSGRLVNAEEAKDGRLVRSIHPHAQLLSAAREVARGFFEHSSPVSLALIRQMLWRMLTEDHPMEAHKLDSRHLMARGSSADAKEGIRAFLEKRVAAFPGKVSRDLPAEVPWWRQREFE
jgi:enoyl-CoA hydratase/carnithine racemase